MFRITLSFFFLMLASTSTFAQSVPPLMNYQGHLTDAAGQPLATGQYTLTFNVYNVPTGGTAVWGPQAIVADVIDGYFNVVLSTDSTGGDSITTAFTAQPRYVSVRVGAASEILPRQQVLSAPYAIRAESASGVSGSANVFPSAGNVGIGVVDPDRALAVAGNAQLSGNLDVTGTIYSGGSLDVLSAQVRGNLAVSGNITFSGQKYCRIVDSGSGWSDMVIVPNTWTQAHCLALRNSLTGNQYFLSCLFSNGTFSMGSSNGGAPSSNCGW